MFVPGVKINDAKESADENRVLAKYIPLMKEHKINLEFGRNFDSWFNDRFFGRYDIISFYEKLICDINFKQENDRAMKGSDGWFFYKSNGSVLNYANLKLFSEPELKLIAEYLSGINDWCEKRNKKFYFLICPDKNKIYGEYYPGYIIKVNSDQKSRSKQLKKYLEANTAVKTVYPYETLIKNKSKGLLYFKGDTHWNSLGAYYAYMDLMDMICVDYEVERFSTGEFELRNSESFDLINMFARSSEEDNMLYKTPILKKNYTLKFVNEKHRGDESSRKEFVLDNNAGSFSVVLFRDSFSTVLLPYLGNTFGKVYSFRGNSIDETVLAGIDNRADIVILEIVERDLVELKNNRFIKK